MCNLIINVRFNKDYLSLKFFGSLGKDIIIGFAFLPSKEYDGGVHFSKDRLDVFLVKRSDSWPRIIFSKLDELSFIATSELYIRLVKFADKDDAVTVSAKVLATVNISCVVKIELFFKINATCS